MITKLLDIEYLNETFNYDSLTGNIISTFPAWVRTVDMLPGEPGEQADVLMWSPEWATWLKGMVTRWENDACEWAIYNQQDDRYHEWEHVPEFWMSPILPNAERIHGANNLQP